MQIQTNQTDAMALAQREAQMAAVLAPPLQPLPNMRGFWRDYGKHGVPFLTAAQDLLDAHKADGGDVRDVEVYDLLSCVIFQPKGTHTLALGEPKSREAYKLRAAAYSDLVGDNYLGMNGGGAYTRDKMPPDLQQAILGAAILRKKAQLKAEGGKDRLPAVLRVRGDEVCAIVSPTYAPLDPPDMLTIIEDIMRERGVINEAMVTSISHGVTDTLQMVFPDAPLVAKVGDITHRGLDFRNSGIGHSSMKTSAFMRRLVCLNGMTRTVQNGRSSVPHRGNRDKMIASVRENVTGALYEGSRAAEDFQASVAVAVNNVAALFASLQSSYGWNQAEVTMARQNLVAEQPGKADEHGAPQLPAATDLYTFTNAVTAAARMVGEGTPTREANADRRLYLEDTAGDFLRAQVRAATRGLPAASVG